MMRRTSSGSVVGVVAAFIVASLPLAPASASPGTTERVSVANSGAQANGSYSEGSALSEDGSLVTFYSDASNLTSGDTNGVYDVFVRDLTSGLTERLSLDSTGVQGNAASYAPAGITADGRYVVFTSEASNLVAGDTNGVSDIFVRDRLADTTERVNLSGSGGQANGGCLGFTGAGSNAQISDDGRFVLFVSWGSNLVPSDTNCKPDVFLRDRTAGTTELISTNPLGNGGNGHSGATSLTMDATARFIAFASDASDLVALDANGAQTDVFLRDRVGGTTD